MIRPLYTPRWRDPGRSPARFVGPRRGAAGGLLAILAAGCAAVPDSTNVPLWSQEPADTAGESDTELAKKTQNPVADLISLPLQNNTDFGVGPDDKVRNVLIVQPVIPAKLSADFNLINRIVMPVIYQPEIVPGQGSEFGLGDTVYTAFISPAAEGKIVWGAGPAIQFPTATDDRLGSRRWALGPSVVVLAMLDKWVVGGLANNIWSVGGSDRPDVNRMLVQPFANYNFGDGWYAVSAPIITADWEAPASNRWIVPLGGGAGKVFRIGAQPVNTSLQAYYNVEHPGLGPEWTLRFQVQLLF